MKEFFLSSFLAFKELNVINQKNINLPVLPLELPQRLIIFNSNCIDKFLRNFDNRMDDTMMAKVSMSGYSLHEILAVASIIQEEAAAVEENELIASVIYNRLNSESLRLLQMDSTVFYAAELMGESFDTGLDSPYNTYAYPGIPAGPIDNPGMAAIEAALEPADTNYYYFAYGKDGLSHFYNDWNSFEQFLASDEYIGADDE